MSFPDIEAPLWGFFALVSYVPAPLGPFLDQLRQSLPGIGFPQAHITLLPPRPLQVRVDLASKHAETVLNKFAAFEVELSTVHRFSETNVLYLDLNIGNDTVRELHDALDTGDLYHSEQFQFHPHLTLGGPIPAETIDIVQAEAERLWESFAASRKFAIDEVVALWANATGDCFKWARLWSYDLRMDQTRTAIAGLSGQKL